MRLRKIKKELDKHHLDAILVSSIPNIIYLTGYTNFLPIEREAFLLITRNQQYFITDSRYSEAVALHVPHFRLIERFPTNPMKKIFEDLKQKHKIKKLGIEETNITVTEGKMLKKCFKHMAHFSINRTIKEPSEIEAIEKACELGDKTFTYILKRIKRGISEKEIAFEIEYFIKKAGGELSFPSIVAFGKNSSVPHHQTSNQELITNNFVLLDFGVKLNNYCSDMTRTVFFGKPSDEQRKIYQTVLTAQQKAIDRLTSDGDSPETVEGHGSSEMNPIKANEVDSVARRYIIQQGYPSIPHSLGHGVGLEVHEAPSLSPNSKSELKPGMVFSIEPGVYEPGIGGVRIEDLVVLEKKGPRLLTKSPKELTVI